MTPSEASDGGISSSGLQNPGYDALGRTTTITLPDGSVSTYSYSGNTTTVTDPAGKWKTYDAAGLRLWKQSIDLVTHVFYNGLDGKPLADFYLQNGSVQGGTPMVYFAGKRIDNGSVEDRLGTAVVQSGKSRKFFPYGEFRSGPVADVQFATYERDWVTKLDYAHQRYYSSQIARFTTPDPDSNSAKPEIPQTFNRYPYVVGDPVNKNDPTGLFFFCDASEDCPIDAVRENDSGAGGAFVGDPQAEAEAAYDQSVDKTMAAANAWEALVAASDLGKVAPSIQAALNVAGTQWVNPTMPGGTDPFDFLDVNQGYDVALDKLNNPDCAGLLAGSSAPASEYLALSGTGAYLQQMMADTTYRAAPIPGGEAQTIDPENVMINRAGSFFRKLSAPNATMNVTIASPTTPGATVTLAIQKADYQAALLLHELGHQTGVFGDDDENPQLNSAFTLSVLQDCFGIKP